MHIKPVCKLLLALCAGCPSAAAYAEPWMSSDYKKEFSCLIEQNQITEAKWAQLAPEAGEGMLRGVSEQAAARYSEVLASYKSLAANWDAREADAGLRALDGAKISEIRLWLGEDGAAYLTSKKTAVGSLLAKLAEGRPLEQADLAAADAYLTPAFSAQVKGAAKYRADSSPKAGKDKVKKISFSGAEKIKGSAGGGSGALNEMFDGGGSTAGAAARLGGGKAGQPSGQIAAAARTPFNTTINTKPVPPLPQSGSGASKPAAADYASMSPEAQRIYQVHAAVVDANKGRSLGSGALRGTLGNYAGWDKQECSGENDRSVYCMYARTLSSAMGWYAGKLPLKDDKAMHNPGIPTAGVKPVTVNLGSGEYMRCYDWAGAVSATAETSGISPQFKKTEVTNSGFLGMGEHHYVTFTGQGKIYISDPWKNGAILMVVPDTSANRKKWVDR